MKPIEVWNDDIDGCRQVGRLLVNPGRGQGGIHLTFQYDSGWLAEGFADAILRHGVNLPDRIELWRRLVFSRMISNGDDHLRNHGFLRNGGGWALSPAFDLNPVPQAERRLETATPVGPNFDGGIDAALRAVSAFGLSLAAAKEALRATAQVVRQWRKEPSLNRQAAMDYESAFENDEVIAAEKLSAPISGPAPNPRRSEKPENRRVISLAVGPF